MECGIVIFDDLHEDMTVHKDIEQMLQSIVDRVHAADIKTQNAAHVRIGKGEALTILVLPEYKNNPYIFRTKYKRGRYLFSKCFSVSSLEFLLYGKPRERLEAQIQDILENRETLEYSRMVETERRIYVEFADGQDSKPPARITTRTILADDLQDYEERE
jgi:hypothetical protein